MTRRAAFLTIVLGLLLVPGRSASAGREPVDGEGRTIRATEILGAQEDSSASQVPSSAAGSGRFAGRGDGDPPRKPQLHYRPDLPGGGCVTDRQPGWYLPLLTFGPSSLFESLPDCAGAAGRPAPTPLDAAYQVWYWQTTLPDPTLATSPPDGAITGLDLYLTIGGQQTMTIDVTALGYGVHLDISSVYDVRWGDPRPDGTPTGAAVTRNHPTQGGPYPHGDLRHQYIERGRATIEVTQKWTARWSAGGQSGTIADRLSTSATRTIPVQEIQAVLTNSSSP